MKSISLFWSILGNFSSWLFNFHFRLQFKNCNCILAIIWTRGTVWQTHLRIENFQKICGEKNGKKYLLCVFLQCWRASSPCWFFNHLKKQFKDSKGKLFGDHSIILICPGLLKHIPWPGSWERETEVSESALPYSKVFMNFGWPEPKNVQLLN